ncbi:large proline-rich protein BAG6 isoform X3 [Malaya genurostris]|uniref:large proline-rich protein BAG6 isoform X3 n=1 Tax=Malaya genurostris TaxID=325434 RepID=UPI0026F3A3FB|nr:large proline-rich protein BAG6 isoform X3 [Malaya genurostris]
MSCTSFGCCLLDNMSKGTRLISSTLRAYWIPDLLITTTLEPCLAITWYLSVAKLTEMINLKVKTLDSQNHDFSVEDDITVRQFKEFIAEKIQVPVDMQRLIYCGRVLSDEKALKEYDVNGKVVHLVQRAPPSARGNSSTGGSTNDEGTRSSARRSRSSDNAARPQIFRGLDDFNTMYFGSMTSIPLNVNATTPPQIPTVSPSSTLCMNRITVARHMLQCADNIVSYLETPERGLNNTAMDILSQQTMESTVFEVGISTVGDVDIPHNQMQNFVQAFQGAVSAAFRQNGISNVTVQQQDTLNPSVQVFGTIPDSAIITPPNTSATATPAQESSGASSGSSSTSSSTSESSADSRRQARPDPSRNQTTSTQTLAEVVQQMRGVQRRMEPFMQQYYEILQNDPTYEEGDSTARENAQRVFDRISEALHYMSHAQHAISDLMLDLQTSSPRHLCCRPILVEQSAFVSSGIAAVPNNINLANLLRASNNNNNPEMGNNNINAQIINLSVPGMGVPVAIGSTVMHPLNPIGSQIRPPVATGPPSGAGAATTIAATTTTTTGSGGTTTGTGNVTPQSQTQQQQGQFARPSLAYLPDDAITRVYIPLYDPSTVRRVQNIIQTMGPSESASSSAVPVSRNNNTNADGHSVNDDSMTASSNTSSTNSRTTTNNANNNAQMQVARLIQAVVNAAPIHADIHVQINAGGNPPGSTASQGAATSTGSSTTTANSNSTSTNSTPPANPIITNTNSTNVNRGNNDSGAQSRFATVTLPTTSTQTRSTSRPHVHSIPPTHVRNVRPIPANMLSSFDRFLPCNSHHIRENSDRAASESSTARNTAANSNNNSSRTTPTSAASQASAPPPEILTTLPFNLFGSQFTLADFEQIVPNPNTLNRVRDSLQAYIIETLFNGQAISETAMQDAINLLIQRLEPVLSRVSNYDLPDYDTRASIENLIRNSIPFCINLIREDSSQQFGVRLLRFLISFVRRFFMILVTCVGQSNAQTFSGELLNMAIFSTQDVPTVSPELLHLFLPAIHRQLERSSRHDQQDIQEFLVIRRHASGQSQAQNRVPSPMEVDDSESTSTPELVSDIAEISISIEPPIVNIDQCAAIVISAAVPSTEASSVAATAASATATTGPCEDVTMTIPVGARNSQLLPPLPPARKEDDEVLPSVVVGSEPWHTHLPPTWLPVISRDITRQRRQIPQGPYSDAYISGMSSKRRKLIAETKPPSDIPSLIASGVRQAFHSTGINSNSFGNTGNSTNNAGTSNTAVNGGPVTLDEIANTISDDQALQSSYCEAMRTSIRERLAKDPDYDANRFPNCSKYFEK